MPKRPRSTFETELANQNLTEPQKRQARFNNINRLDAKLKLERDEKTGTLGFVEEMNHLIGELGERGFSFRKVNEIMGRQISQYARTTKDRRKLQLLDQIKTPGGNFGNTLLGQRLKQQTIDQIDADEIEDINLQIKFENYEKGKITENYKRELGFLVNQREAEVDPQKKEEITAQIDQILSSARESGVGDLIENYYSKSTKSLYEPDAIEKRIVNLDSLFDVNDPKGRTIHDRLVEDVLSLPTDTSKEAREANISEWLIDRGFSLDKDGTEQLKALTENFVSYSNSSEYKNGVSLWRGLVNTALSPFNKTMTSAERILSIGGGAGGTPKTIPYELHKMINKAKGDFTVAFQDAFDEYNNSLEKRLDDPRYGYKSWTKDDRKGFFESEKYKEALSILEKFNNDAQVYHNNVTIPKKNYEDIHDRNVSYYMPSQTYGPKTRNSLIDMLWSDDDRPENPTQAIIKDRFHQVLFGIAEKEFKGKEYERVHKVFQFSTQAWATDVLKWFEDASKGALSVNQKRDVLKKVWEWGHYVIKHYEKRKVSNDFRDLSPSVLKTFKEIDKFKVKAPEKLKNILGLRKKVKKELEKKRAEVSKKKPKNKTDSKSEFSDKDIDAYMDGKITLEQLLNK